MTTMEEVVRGLQAQVAQMQAHLQEKEAQHGSPSRHQELPFRFQLPWVILLREPVKTI